MRYLKWIGGLFVIFVAIRTLAWIMIPGPIAGPIDVKDTMDVVRAAVFFGIVMLLTLGYAIAAFKAAFGKH